jgi:hypothetical protein
MNKRHLLPALLAASLTLAAVSPAIAQKVNKSGRPGTAAVTSDDAQMADREMRQALADPRLADENERFNSQINQEMFQLRQQLIRESMNKMHQRGQGGNSNFEPRQLIGDVAAFAVFVLLLGGLMWLVRTIMENRRWNRVASIQTDMHTKLLEKMASSQELLAYMETEAGKRFLESSPFEIETRTNPTFPIGRILLSAQAGVVILFVGAASIWLENRLPDDAQGLLVFGTLAMAVGFGLLISAVVAYSVSRHFGLTPSSQREAQ